MRSQVKTKERVRQHGEVFTAEREVMAMMDLVKERIFLTHHNTLLSVPVWHTFPCAEQRRVHRRADFQLDLF